jgi:hypothetical protein
MYMVLSFFFLPSMRLSNPLTTPTLDLVRLAIDVWTFPGVSSVSPACVSHVASPNENSSGSGAAVRLGSFIGQRQGPVKIEQLSVSLG